MKRTSKILSLALALLMALTLLPVTAFAADDITGHWAEETLRDWAADGLLSGDGNGTYRPNASITRAEFFALINRWKGYTAESDAIGQYTDVSPDKWYYKEVAAALAAGYTSGTGETAMSPEKPITREEAMTIVARIGGLAASSDTSVLSKASDGGAVSAWAKGPVAAVINEGIVAGSNGRINPLSNITRAEAVVLFDRVRSDARTYAFAGTYGPASGSKSVGSVTVSAPGVVLQNMTVKGNVTVAESVGEGEATFNGVTVEGLVNVLGGGLNSVYFNNCTIREMTVEKDRVRVVFDNGSTIGFARTFGTDDVIEIKGSTTIETLTVVGNDATIRAEATVAITTLNAEASGTALETQAGTKIGTANISGETTVTGAGTITTANITAEGVSIETRPGTTNVESGLSANVGGQTVTGGSTASAGGGGGGGGTGGGSGGTGGNGGDGGNGGNGGTTAPTYSKHNVADKTVPYGTVFGDLNLPASVTLTSSTNSTATANVVWNSGAYNPNSATAQSISGTVSNLVYATQGETWAPATITVTVTVQAALTANPLALPDRTVKSDVDQAAAEALLPTTVTLTLSDDSTVQVSVVWAISGTYSQAAEAENTFNGTVSGLPATVTGTPAITAKIIIAASDDPAPTSIALTATPGSVQRPTDDTDATVALSAVVKDQFGDTMNGEAVTYALVENDDPEVTYGIVTGTPTVTITKDSTATAVTVSATVDAATSVTDEITINISDEEIVATSIAITDSVSSMTLPATGGDPSAYTFKAEVKDQNGALMSEAVTWRLKAAVVGVSVDPATGAVSVADTASVGSFTVVATSGELTAEQPVSIVKATSAAASVTIAGVGADTITLPASAATTANTKTYTAEVKDQYGVVMGGAAVTWAIQDAPVTGVSVANGVLSVDKTAQAGTVTITATVDGVTPATKTVTIEKAAPVATTVTVNGDASIELPALAATAANTKPYTVTVTDQYGEAIADPTVVWSVPAGMTGVSISAAGVLSVTKDAAPGSVTVTAEVTNADNTKASGTKDVGIVKATPVATSITVTGPTTVKTESSNNQYTASVKDQYGAAMTAAVTWSIDDLDPPGTGVNIEQNLGTVDLTAAVTEGTTFTVKATLSTDEAIFGTLDVTVSNTALPAPALTLSVNAEGNMDATLTNSTAYTELTSESLVIGVIEKGATIGATGSSSVFLLHSSQTMPFTNLQDRNYVFPGAINSNTWLSIAQNCDSGDEIQLAAFFRAGGNERLSDVTLLDIDFTKDTTKVPSITKVESVSFAGGQVAEVTLGSVESGYRYGALVWEDGDDSPLPRTGGTITGNVVRFNSITNLSNVAKMQVLGGKVTVNGQSITIETTDFSNTWTPGGTDPNDEEVTITNLRFIEGNNDMPMLAFDYTGDPDEIYMFRYSSSSDGGETWKVVSNTSTNNIDQEAYPNLISGVTTFPGNPPVTADGTYKFKIEALSEEDITTVLADAVSPGSLTITVDPALSFKATLENVAGGEADDLVVTMTDGSNFRAGIIYYVHEPMTGSPQMQANDAAQLVKQDRADYGTNVGSIVYLISGYDFVITGDNATIKVTECASATVVEAGE